MLSLAAGLDSVAEVALCGLCQLIERLLAPRPGQGECVDEGADPPDVLLLRGALLEGFHGPRGAAQAEGVVEPLVVRPVLRVHLADEQRSGLAGPRCQGSGGLDGLPVAATRIGLLGACHRVARPEQRDEGVPVPCPAHLSDLEDAADDGRRLAVLSVEDPRQVPNLPGCLVEVHEPGVDDGVGPGRHCVGAEHRLEVAGDGLGVPAEMLEAASLVAGIALSVAPEAGSAPGAKGVSGPARSIGVEGALVVAHGR